MVNLFEQPVLKRGFRSFFFLAAVYCIVSLVMWGSYYAGAIDLPLIMLDPVSWHAHEMIYGFALAVVAGFLLTAVANWTGTVAVRKQELALLCFLWLLGRVVVNINVGLPEWAVIVMAVSFIPAFAFSLSRPLIKTKNKRNFIFLGLLSVLFACELWFFIAQDITPLYVALMMVVTMVSLIGGRIIPMFTTNGLRRHGIFVRVEEQMKMDLAALVSLLAVALSLIFAAGTPVLTVTAGASAIIHLLRMRKYHSLKTYVDPLLWILHAGIFWIVIGMVLFALSGLGIVEMATVVHAFTVGAVGSMTLGMMTRVTMGHTGREFFVSKLTHGAFIALQLAAIIRIFGPIALPEYTSQFVSHTAVLFAACFLVYLIGYAPMLFTRRPDGMPD